MEANYVKLAQKEEKDQVLDLQERMDKKIIKPSTLKISTRLNIKKPREKNYEALNVATDNGTTENIEELDKLSQNLEDKMWFLQLIFFEILDLYHHM